MQQDPQAQGEFNENTLGILRETKNQIEMLTRMIDQLSQRVERLDSRLSDLEADR